MSLFDNLKDFGTKIFDVGEFAVDNLVFKLHRIVTVVLLLSFSVVTSLGQVRRYKQVILLQFLTCNTVFQLIVENVLCIFITVCWRPYRMH